ncbi:MAG: hypothetical protein SWK76_06625 [Actinomycetota bacterium]|nr:hypothetical protein [Actinomycetota bacterium]
MKRTIALVLALAAIALLMGVPPAHAQDFDLAVTPAKVELTVDPGQTVDFSIELLNQVDEPLPLSVYAMDYYVESDNTFIFEEPGYYSYSCSSWVDIADGEVSVPANSSLDVPFKLNVSEDAEPGGHYGVIFFQDAREPEPGQGAAPSPRIGALILLTIPGEIVREGSIAGFEVQNDFFSLWGPPRGGEGGWPARSISYHLEVENSGNVHITVCAEIHYRSRFGFGSGTVGLGTMTILPGTVRYFDGFLPSPPCMGIYKAEAIIQYGPDLVTFDVEKRAETGFVVIPVIWIVLVILLLAALIWVIARRRKKRKMGMGPRGEEGKKSSGRAEIRELIEGETGAGSPAGVEDETKGLIQEGRMHERPAGGEDGGEAGYAARLEGEGEPPGE